MLSCALGAELIELTCRLPRIVKYAALVIRTTAGVATRQPSILVVQCPSLILGAWAAVLKRIFRFTLVADLHNEGVRPCVQRSALSQMLRRFIQRTADLCLVSNRNLKPDVESAGGRAFVIPDKVPDLPEGQSLRSKAGLDVVCVCTYAPDEPYLEVIEAARSLDPSVTVHITGDCRDVAHVLPPSPAHLTGFLPEADYVALLRSSDLIVDLTGLEDCLVCGAYEAVALEKALVTSDTTALRDYFRLGTVYTRHDHRSLAAAMTYALEHRDRLAAEMKTLKQELARDWAEQNDMLRRALHLAAPDQPSQEAVS